MAEDMIRQMDGLFKGLSGTTSVNVGANVVSPGGKASFAHAVKDTYSNAWDPLRAGVVGDKAVTVATITVAGNGDVITARILRPSGDALMDKSVQQTLDTVRNVSPSQ